MRIYFSVLLLLFLVGCDDPVVEQDTPQEQEIVAAPPSPFDSINQLIIENPDNIDHFLHRAVMYRDIDSLEQAMLDIQRVLRIDSTIAEAHHVEGDILFKSQAIDLAMDEFDTCLEYDPEHVDCLLKKAEIQLLLKQYDDAVSLINRALVVDQFVPHAYFMKGILYKEQGDTNLAVSSFITATEVDPNFYDAYMQIGLLYASVQNDLALEYYNSALDVSPSSVEALYAKGMFLQESANGEEARLRDAMAVYDYIDEIEDGFAASAYNRGYIYLEYLTEYDSAATEFSTAIERYPGYFQAFYNRGLCWESMDELQRALNDYDKALHIKPDYTPAAIAKGRVLGN